VQLNCLVLRGIRSSAENLTTQRRHFANLAVTSAINTLEDILTIPDIARSVVGVPLYLTTLLSFCTIFLLKVQLTWKNLHLSVDASQVMTLLERVLNLLEGAKTSKRHLAPHMAVGIKKTLAKFRTKAARSSRHKAKAAAAAAAQAHQLQPQQQLQQQHQHQHQQQQQQEMMMGTHSPSPAMMGSGMPLDVVAAAGDPSIGGWGQYSSPLPDDMYGDMMGFYGLEEQYFPLGIFDALPAQVPL
jgi:hypothetical protein